MLTMLEIVLPSCVAIIILALFNLPSMTDRNRKLCYIISGLCVLAELAPITINLPALAICSVALTAMFILDKVRIMHRSPTDMLNAQSQK